MESHVKICVCIQNDLRCKNQMLQQIKIKEKCQICYFSAVVFNWNVLVGKWENKNKSKGRSKKTWKNRFSSFLHFLLFLLFYSRKNIKHSENIFHILRAIQNVLHGFSSRNLFFFKHIHWVSDACTCTITKIKLTNKKREEKGGKHNTLGEPRGDGHFF